MLDFPDDIILSPPSQSTKIEEERSETNLASFYIYIYEKVVNNTMRDLDAFSPKRMTIPQSPQRRPVLEEEDFQDLSEVPMDICAHVKNSNPSEQALDDIYKGIKDKAMTELAI